MRPPSENVFAMRRRFVAPFRVNVIALSVWAGLAGIA